MGAWSFSRALLWAFATHGALVGALAAQARQTTAPLGELATIELETLEQASIQAEPPPAPQTADVPAAAPRPRASQANHAVTTKPATQVDPAEMTAGESDETSPRASEAGTSESDGASGAESATRPQTAAASSQPPTPLRGPILLGREGCLRYFPHDAQTEEGTVTVTVEVSPTGEAAGTRIVQESPVGNGFGQAATLCATSLHFAPAIGEGGVPVRAVATLELHFTRPRRRDALSLR